MPYNVKVSFGVGFELEHRLDLSRAFGIALKEHAVHCIIVDPAIVAVGMIAAIRVP